MDLESESVLSFIYQVAKNNGGYLTVREAARSCEKKFGHLFPDNGDNRSSFSSDSSGCSSCGNNSNTRNNDREEANERKLKNLIRSSEMFKLNGNVLFVNIKAQPQMKAVITNRPHLTELRRNSLPELTTDIEIVTKICKDLELKREKSDSIANIISVMSSVKSAAVKSINNFKELIAKYPAHFDIQGDNVKLIVKNQGSTYQSAGCEQLSKRLEHYSRREADSVPSKIPRSHSLDECDAIPDDHLGHSKSTHARLPPSYLATPGLFSCIHENLSLSEMDYFSKKYKNSDRIVSIMKNFETDVQMAVDRLIKQMRSELDSMLVDLHRPVNKNLGEGTVFCVQKKWGIIDLGNHDHVFFDMSIMLGSVDDLRNHFQVGEVLGFEAVRAQKSSRANWRAIRVWKVDKSENLQKRIPSYQNDVSTKKRPQVQVQDKTFGRLCESGSSKGNSPDSSPGRWKKRQTNPLSKAIDRDRSFGYTEGNRPYFDPHPQSTKSGSSSAWGHTPLFSRTSFPLNTNEVRLLPSRMLTPPSMKKTDSPPSVAKSLTIKNHEHGLTSSSNNLQILTVVQTLRDSGTESGNSSPDALPKVEASLKDRGASTRQNDLNNAYCQTENDV